MTIGTLAGELCRRITGHGIQQYYETHIRQPRGIDAYLGVPDSETSRIVRVPLAAPPREPGDDGLDAMVRSSLRGAFTLDNLANSDRGHRAGNPAAGGVASAAGLAELYAAALWDNDHGRIFSSETADRVNRIAASGHDLANGESRTFAILFQKPTHVRPFAGFTAFGHEGSGGAMAYADPGSDIVLAYIPSRDPGEADVDALSLLARRIASGV